MLNKLKRMFHSAVKRWIDNARDKESGEVNWFILAFSGVINLSSIIAAIPFVIALTELVKSLGDLAIVLVNVLVVLLKIIQLLTTILSYQLTKDRSLFFYGFNKNKTLSC